MPPAPQPQQRIVEAAARLQGQGRALTMASLAEAAGLSRATLYRHVGGRKGLGALLRARGVGWAASPRERLLAQARALIAAHGPHGFSLEELAHEAEVSPTTVYREFGDRPGLLRAVMQGIGPPTELVMLLADVEAPLEQVLTRFVAGMAERLLAQPFMLQLMLLQAPGALRELRRLRRVEEGLSVNLGRYFAAQVERGRLVAEDPALLAPALMGLVAALVIRSRVEPLPPEQREAQARALVSLFLHGVAATPRRPLSRPR